MQNDTKMPPGTRHATGKLEALLRVSAQHLFEKILDAECERFLRTFDKGCDAAGRAAVVRNGYQPTRSIETGIGPVSIRMRKVRSRTGVDAVFRSRIVPRYVRSTRVSAREAVWRYLYGSWCCDLNQVLVALLGARATHLAGAVPESVRSTWVEDCVHKRCVPVGEHRPVEIWAECVMPDPLWQAAPGSMLVVIGANANGALSLLALDHGLGDTHSRWLKVVQDLLSRGLLLPERINATAAANGFGKALEMRTPKLTQCDAYASNVL